MRGGGLWFEDPWPMGKMSGRAGGKKWGLAVKKSPLLKKMWVAEEKDGG